MVENIATDVKWELTILEIVNGFNVELLHKAIQDEVVVPAGLDAESLKSPADGPKTLANMRAWLKVLDLAITPALIREALTANIDQDNAEALLRYFVRKKSHTDIDRDKTDFLVTYLYRNPRVKGQWELRGYSMDGVAPMPPFEIALLEILEDAELPELNAEHARVLEEFDHLRAEAEDFRDFDQLMDSEIIQRVRHMKNSFGPALYHPHVLAVIAPYNAFFSARFEELFKAATEHIKTFADNVQQKGGSLHAPVSGDVTVKQLMEVRETEILASEYLKAHEQLRHVSKLKKAVDSRSGAQKGSQSPYGPPPVPPPPAPPVQTPSATAVQAAAAVSPNYGPPAPPAPRVTAPPVAVPAFAPPRPPAPPVSPFAGAPSTPAHPAGPAITHEVVQGGPPPAVAAAAKKVEEENRLQSVQESIKSFVKAADPKMRSVIPMGFGNLVLTPAEADAYCADYLQEDSFRGENARVLVRIPALIARMTSEIEQLERQQNLKYLWRPHADSLTALLAIAKELSDMAHKLAALANQRGLTEKVNALNASLHKLNAKTGQSNTMLAMMNARE